MWGRIVKAMEKGTILDGSLKKAVWESLFSFSGRDHYCFACHWADQDIDEDHGDSGNCENCLLDVDEDEDCLNGLYDIATGISDQRIEAARKIRDLDMKDKWK